MSPARLGSPTRVLGLDIGGTKLAAGVAAEDGTVESFRWAPTPVERGPDAVLACLVQLGRAACADAGVDPGDLEAVGVGCGGPLDAATGVVSNPPALPDWDDVAVTDVVERALHRPAFLENDGTAGALGQFRWANPDRVANLVYMTVSTGVGGGVVIDNTLFRGAAGNGGELGHIVVDWQGRRCGCGARGCAEAYVSGTSIARRAAEAIAAGARYTDTSSLGRLPAPVTAREVSLAARAGDPYAVSLWAESMAMLGRVVAVVINVYEPDLVVLGGGVTRAGAMFLDPVRSAALSQAMPPAAARARIILSPHDDRAGVLGAAAVAFDRLGARV